MPDRCYVCDVPDTEPSFGFRLCRKHHEEAMSMLPLGDRSAVQIVENMRFEVQYGEEQKRFMAPVYRLERMRENHRKREHHA